MYQPENKSMPGLRARTRNLREAAQKQNKQQSTAQALALLAPKQ